MFLLLDREFISLVRQDFSYFHSCFALVKISKNTCLTREINSLSNNKTLNILYILVLMANKTEPEVVHGVLDIHDY